jgi:hypothetical protein
MCIYLNISGDGTGTVTFTSYTLNGTAHSLSLAPCARQGGITTGTCVLQISVAVGTVVSSLSVTRHVDADGYSCFTYQGGACTGGGLTVARAFTWAPTATDSDFGLKLYSPETLNLTLGGTGTGTVVSTPRGISCPGKCSADFPAGSTVQLTATPTGTDTFAGYAGPSCLGGFHSPSCSWVINSTLDITAVFDLPVTPPPPPTATPTPTKSPTPTTRPTLHPTLPPGATPAPSSGAAAPPTEGATEGASEVASEPTTPGPGESPSEQASLVPIATPSTSPVSSSGGDGSGFVIPIVAAVLAVGGYLLIGRLRRT